LRDYLRAPDMTAGVPAGPAAASGGPRQGDTVRLAAADGHRLDAYRIRPTAPVAALVVLQEIFGVNQHMRDVCDDYSRRGFSVVAPALFDRAARRIELDYGPESVETGRRLRAAIGWDETLLDVQAAIDAVRADGPVAVLGYCWGGTLAFLAATRLDGVGCAISYYGGQTVPFAKETPQVPVLMHFGEFDPRIPVEDRATIQAANPQIETHIFPADHGFNCNHRKEYDAQIAERALGLTLDFMTRHLNLKGKLENGSRH